MKLRCAVLQGLGLNGPKIARSVTKVGVHARVGIKGVQIARNIAKVGVHIFISNGNPNL